MRLQLKMRRGAALVGVAVVDAEAAGEEEDGAADGVAEDGEVVAVVVDGEVVEAEVGRQEDVDALRLELTA